MSEGALEADTLVRARPQVLSCEVGGEAVLLEPDSGKYFGLNEVGSRIWSLLAPGPERLGAVQERLLGEYEVAPGELWRDLVELVGALARHGLAEVIEIERESTVLGSSRSTTNNDHGRRLVHGAEPRDSCNEGG